MTGSLIVLMVETKLDIAFAIALAARFFKNPSYQHTKAIKIIFKYLKALKSKELYMAGLARKLLRFKLIPILTRLVTRKDKNQHAVISSCLIGACKLVFEKAIYNSIIINRSKIHQSNFSEQRHNIAIFATY